MPYRIVIAEEDFTLARQLKQKVESMNYAVVGSVKNSIKLAELVGREEIDLIIMGESFLLDDFTTAGSMEQQALSLPIIVTLAGDAESVKCAARDNIMAYLVRPFSCAYLSASIDLAVMRFSEIRMLKQEVDELHTAIAHRKIIERAKGILMDHFRMTESEAFRKLQLISQQENRPMAEIAESVITTHNLLKDQRLNPDDLEGVYSR